MRQSDLLDFHNQKIIELNPDLLLPGALKWLHEYPSPSPLPKAWGEG